MLNNCLTLENISKRFASRPGSTTQLQVLDNIQLDIAPASSSALSVPAAAASPRCCA